MIDGPLDGAPGSAPGLKFKVKDCGELQLKPGLDLLRKRLGDLERRIEGLGQSDHTRVFGSVFASSGLDRTYRVREPASYATREWAMDWALIRVDDARLGL